MSQAPPLHHRHRQSFAYRPGSGSRARSVREHPRSPAIQTCSGSLRAARTRRHREQDDPFMYAPSRRTLLSVGVSVTGVGALSGSQVVAAEAARKSSGRTVNAKLTAVTGTVDLGGVKAATWTFDGALPG